MKLRVDGVVEDDAGQEMQLIVVMNKFCDTFDPVNGLSLSLSDGKDLLGAVQQHVRQAQVNAFSCDNSHRHHDQMFSPGLGHSRLRREGYFHPASIRQKWAEHLSGGRNWQYHLWDVLMFQAWLAENET